MALKQWSGWAVMKEGSMPRLYGDRQIAELNCRQEYDEFLVFLHTDQERTHEDDLTRSASVSLLSEKDTWNLVVFCEHLWRNRPASTKDLDQQALRRLVELGAVAFYGDGRYVLTALGYWCYQTEMGHTRPLPLRLVGDT